jgi:hypothetical protein
MMLLTLSEDKEWKKEDLLQTHRPTAQAVLTSAIWVKISLRQNRFEHAKVIGRYRMMTACGSCRSCGTSWLSVHLL